MNDLWTGLRRLTPARIALGRSGTGLPTDAVLGFALAHAKARDAVHAALDVPALEAAIGVETLTLASAAPSREAYLRRPDLGRRLSPEAIAALEGRSADLALVIADGLSATAVQAHAAPMIKALLPWIAERGWSAVPVVIATQARVALGDEVGAKLGAHMTLLLIGERPGLTAPDSLGAYLTFGPRVGRSDAERNCVSNIHGGGLSYDQAAFKLAWLMGEADKRSLTGVALKDDSDRLLVTAPTTPSLT